MPMRSGWTRFNVKDDIAILEQADKCGKNIRRCGEDEGDTL